MNGINNISVQNQAISQNLLRDQNLFNSLILQSGSRQIDPPKGTLLPTYDPVTNFIIGTVNTGKDAGKFVKAVATGKSDDTSLGRMNDLGLKLGGAGIASYLATKRVTSTTKGMEWIGFAAFMAAMSLWPKLFVNFPMRVKHGFRIDQRYKSADEIERPGVEKPFFLDNQYLPWDLWKDEEIDAIADKNHIGKDIKDRRELTQGWMRKTALQGQTLATLTAGAGVPLITAMACNRIEDKLVDFNIKRAFDGVMKDMGKINKAIGESGGNLWEAGNILDTALPVVTDVKASRAVEKILKDYKTKPIDAKFYEKLGEVMNPLNVLKNESDSDSLKAVQSLVFENYEKAVADNLKKLCTEKVGPKKGESVAEALFSQFGDKIKKSAGITKAKRGRTEALNLDQLKKILGSGDLDAQSALDILSNKKITVEGGDLTAAVKSLFGDGTKPMDEVASSVMEEFERISNARFGVFARFANAVAGNRAESVFTRSYNGMSKAFLHQMNPSMKEMSGFIRPAEKSTETKAIGDFVISRMQEIAEWTKGEKSESTGHYFIKNIKKHMEKMFKIGSDSSDPMKQFTDALPLLQDKETATALTEFIKTSRLDKESSAMRLFTALDFEKRARSLSEVQYGTKEVTKKVLDDARRIIYSQTATSLGSGGEGVDKQIRKLALDLLFGAKVDKDVENVVSTNFSIAKPTVGSDSGFLQRLDDYRKRALELLTPGGEISNEKDATSLGEPIVNMFKKGCEQRYNKAKWMRGFGIATAAVIGVTLLAQFFIGRTKKEEKLYRDKGVQNAK